MHRYHKICYKYTYCLHTYVFEPLRQKMYLLTCASNEDSIQPAHPRSLIRVFVVRMEKLCTLVYPKCAELRFWSDCPDIQADLNLYWVHMSKSMLSDFVAALYISVNRYMNMYGIVLLFGLPASPIIGAIMDWKRKYGELIKTYKGINTAINIGWFIIVLL